MRNSALAKALAATITTALLTLSVAGCSVSTGEAAGSRHVLYASIDALARDSTAIVAGSVTAQVADGDTIISTVVVANAPSNPQLGANAPAARPVAVGDSIQVRQDPSSRPLLEMGREYMLWVTPSMLPGDAASQFFITGGNAGLYLRDGDIARRAVSDTGDSLPETISIAGSS